MGKSCLPLTINNSRYIVSAFAYAKGKAWDERTDHSEETLMAIGKAIGKIHRLSKDYTPVQVAKRRLWSEQQELLNAELLKNHSVALYDQFLTFMRQMDNEEKNKDNFGLTHGYYLVANYLIDEKNYITVIDFDECEYSWFAVDLAICMRCYLFWTENPSELPHKAKEAEIMHYNLLIGYRSENRVTEEMIFGLEQYIKIRDFIELIQLLGQHEHSDMDKILLEMILDRILNNKPFLVFNIENAKNRFL